MQALMSSGSLCARFRECSLYVIEHSRFKCWVNLSSGYQDEPPVKLGNVMQALMSSGSFCGLMGKLQTAQPALEQARLTTLTALATFAHDFAPLEPTRTPGVPVNAAQPSSTAGDTAPASGSGASSSGAANDSEWDVSPAKADKDGASPASTEAKSTESKPG